MVKGSIILLILTSLLVVASSLPLETEVDEQRNEEGKLNVITITQEEIEGEYHSPSGGGIHFKSVVRGEYHFLSITTTEGEPLVIAKQPHNSTTLMTLTGIDFLVMKTPSESGPTKYTDYIVPNVFHKNVEKALKWNRFSGKLLEQLDTEVNETRQSTIENLALRPEIELCLSAAQALGDLGVVGAQNPAAMPFFALTLRLMKYRAILNGNELTTINDIIGNRRETVDDRQKRSCSLCTHGSCPYYGYGNDCYGMCGIRCWCQSWFCGDCCVHQGCLGHDYCCGEYGYTSWSCITVWNIDCDSSYSC